MTSKHNSALKWVEKFKLRHFSLEYVLSSVFSSKCTCYCYGAQEIKNRLSIAKNISSPLRQEIIKTFTSGEKVTEHKLLKKQFPLVLEGNFIPGAKQLKYKQTSTTSDQIRFRIWGLKMGPVTTGCWREPTKSRAPSPSSLHFWTTHSPLERQPLCSLCRSLAGCCISGKGPCYLTCSCQSTSLARYPL